MAKTKPLSLEGRGVGERVMAMLKTSPLAHMFTLSPTLPPQGGGSKNAPLLTPEELAPIRIS